MEEKHEVLQVLQSPSRHVKKLRITATYNIKTADNRSTCNSAMNTYMWVAHSIEDIGIPMYTIHA